ncbi:MAG TPA: hypothetical protein VM779_14420 [Thermoanaerobaculia bacterium]|nr:hypothetical protein [Thermoanaerobaculia bacterium]
MDEPESEHQVSKKVVYEQVSSTSSGNSVAAWIIIGVLAIALIAYIVMRMT